MAFEEPVFPIKVSEKLQKINQVVDEVWTERTEALYV